MWLETPQPLDLNSFLALKDVGIMARVEPASVYLTLPRKRSFLYAGALSFVLVVVAVTCFGLLYVRQQAENRMVAHSQALVKSLELMFVGQIDAIDVALLAVSSEIGQQAYIHKASPEKIDRYLELIRSGLPHTDLIRATNEQGDIIYGQGPPFVSTNIADRDYFRQLRDSPDPGMLMVHTLIGKLDQKARWPFARRINKPDGTFGGVVIASMQISDVVAMLNRVTHDYGSVVALRDQDFALIARQGNNTRVNIGDQKMSARFIEMFKNNPTEGTYDLSAAQSVDGVNRTFSYRFNSDHHFLVAEGLDRDAELASVNSAARIAGVVLFAFALGVLLLTRFIDRYWRSQETNIAIRKESESRLSESEERFRTIVDHNNSIILEIDPGNGHILDANPAACSFYGWSHEVICSKSMSEINQLDPKTVEAGYQAATNEARNTLIFLHRIASGEIKTVEVYSTPVTINGKSVLISIIHDITSRKTAEESLAVEAGKRAAELIVANLANEELLFQSGERAKRAAELVVANVELAFQNEEKAKRAAELVIANVELAFQNEEKAKRAAELVVANVELAFQSEEKAKRAAELLETASDGIHIVDEQGRLKQWSRSFARMLGYTQEEMVGLKATDWDAKFSRRQLSQMIKDVMDTPRTVETIHRRKDGTLIYVEIHAKGIRIDGKNYLYASSRDITERKQLQEQILQLAFYDPLTKLANRRLLDDRLSQVLAENRRNRCHGAMLFIDLDDFKPLNDTHGHDAGDLLLIEVAQRLKSSVREVDTVARTGGDEFVVVISELERDLTIARRRALTIADKIRLALAEPYVLEMHHDEHAASKLEHHCTASIGVVLFSGDAASKDQLLKRADNAMYQAKESGRNRIQFDNMEG